MKRLNPVDVYPPKPSSDASDQQITSNFVKVMLLIEVPTVVTWSRKFNNRDRSFCSSDEMCWLSYLMHRRSRFLILSRKNLAGKKTMAVYVNRPSIFLTSSYVVVLVVITLVISSLHTMFLYTGRWTRKCRVFTSQPRAVFCSFGAPSSWSFFFDNGSLRGWISPPNDLNMVCTARATASCSFETFSPKSRQAAIPSSIYPSTEPGCAERY